MGLFDSLANSFEKQARQQESRARISYSRELSSAYDKTDDPAKKNAIAKAYKENSEALRNLKR